MKRLPRLTGSAPNAVERHAFGDIDMPNLPQAACRDEDPDLWFNVPTKMHDRNVLSEDARRAIDISNICPEQQPCLEWALSRDEWHGIWGGLLPFDRMNMARRRA